MLYNFVVFISANALTHEIVAAKVILFIVFAYVLYKHSIVGREGLIKIGGFSFTLSPVADSSTD